MLEERSRGAILMKKQERRKESKPECCTAEHGEELLCSRTCELCPRVRGFDYDKLHGPVDTSKPIIVRFNPESGALMSDTEAEMYKQDISHWPFARIEQLEGLVDKLGTDEAFVGEIECLEGVYEFHWDKLRYIKKEVKPNAD
jgi:hypothetical protein